MPMSDPGSPKRARHSRTAPGWRLDDLWRGIWESEVATGLLLLVLIALAMALSGLVTGSFDNWHVVLAGLGTLALIISVGIVMRRRRR